MFEWALDEEDERVDFTGNTYSKYTVTLVVRRWERHLFVTFSDGGINVRMSVGWGE